MAILKYRAINKSIKPVEIERETGKSVFFKTEFRGVCQERKITEDSAYCDTWKEAKDFLLSKALKKMDDAQKAYKYYEDAYNRIVGLKQ